MSALDAEGTLRTDLLLDEYYESKEDKRVFKLGQIYADFSDVNHYYYLGADLSDVLRGGTAKDLQIISEEDNLAQAILHRLRTIRGELYDTGHPEYGCGIYELIGEPDVEITRERIKMMVREALLQEPRVKEILGIQVRSRRSRPASLMKKSEDSSRLSNGNYSFHIRTTSEDLSTVDIDILVKPVGGSESPLNISFPFSLERV